MWASNQQNFLAALSYAARKTLQAVKTFDFFELECPASYLPQTVQGVSGSSCTLPVWFWGDGVLLYTIEPCLLENLVATREQFVPDLLLEPKENPGARVRSLVG